MTPEMQAGERRANARHAGPLDMGARRQSPGILQAAALRVEKL